MEQYIRICPVCGIEFNARMGRYKKCKTHCSIACSNKSRSLELTDCPICGKPFKSKASKEGRKRYCSKACGYRSRKGRPSPKRYPESVRQYVYTNYPAGDIEMIARRLGISYGAVQQIAQKGGVKRELTAMCKTNSERMLLHNPMHNPAFVEKVKQFYRDNPDKKALRLQAMTSGKSLAMKSKPSKPEFKCAAILDELDVLYEHQAVIKDKFIVDFRINDIILQIDGEYWHGHPRFEPLTDRQITQKKRDASQDKYLIACGYSVIRVWERDVNISTIRRLLNL